MKYESKRTEKGNIGVSWNNQEEADMQAIKMDRNNNTNCYNCSHCSDCSDCSGCSDCSDCSNCSYCSGCSDCSYCSNCSYCSGCSDCSDCSRCSRCSDCSDCSGCSDCSYCSGILRWSGNEVSNLIGLNGLYWPIAISKTHIQIGCQNHGIERWEEFTDKQIAAMDDKALEFWKENKSLIMAIAKRG